MSEVRFDVPVPTKKEFGKSGKNYGFEEFTEPNSFKFYPNVKPANVWSSITYWKKKNPEFADWKFIIRKYEENDMVGTGVWRSE